MKTGLISFVILTYKNFSGIYDTLDSLFMQDYPDIEIVISDDCSPDAQMELDRVEKYIDTHKGPNISNVIIRRGEVNLGTVRNINAAIKLCNGEYIKDFGAEDMLANEHVLSRYREFLDASGCLICCAKVQGVTPDGEIKNALASCAEDYDVLDRYTPTELRNRLFWRNCLPSPAMFMKRELYDKYGYYDENIRLIEDYPYWLHLCSAGAKIAFLDERLITYKLSGVSSAGNYSRMFMEDMVRIYDKYIFPYDKRYGIFQGFYNHLKREGLGAYIAKADWDDYSTGQRVLANVRYGPFFFYIWASNLKYK